MLKRLLGLLSIIAATNSTVGAENFEKSLEGTWRGHLQSIDPQVQNDIFPDVADVPEFLEYAVEISENTTRVFVRVDGSWTEIKPDTFGLVAHKANAIVAATDSSLSVDGASGWVETWNFTITAKGDDSLYAYWVRAVNNVHLKDGSSPHARFMLSRFGVLQRSNPILDVDAVQASIEAPSDTCRQSNFLCGDERKYTDYQKGNEKIDQNR